MIWVHLSKKKKKEILGFPGSHKNHSNFRLALYTVVNICELKWSFVNKYNKKWGIISPLYLCIRVDPHFLNSEKINFSFDKLDYLQKIFFLSF